MSYSSCFPGLTLGLVPSSLAVPLFDDSYHNDSCARFEERVADDAAGLALWIDYADERSDYYGTSYHYRYMLTFDVYGSQAETLLQTNDADEMTRKVAAIALARN